MSSLKDLIKDTKELTSINNERRQRAATLACITGFMGLPDDMPIKQAKEKIARAFFDSLERVSVDDEIEQETKKAALKYLPVVSRTMTKLKSVFK